MNRIAECPVSETYFTNNPLNSGDTKYNSKFVQKTQQCGKSKKIFLYGKIKFGEEHIQATAMSVTNKNRNSPPKQSIKFQRHILS